ncbi:restriction endonuclease subunit S [Acinetobacter baumannii]|uniref:restriction endonuclease subunit S n=1 Tax=Acinetobacter baumannii TaxID=470 RepID=UPI0038929BD1
MKNSLINEIRLPSGWELKNLKDMTCSFKSGFSITSENISEDTTLFPVYGGNGLRGYTSTFTHDSAYTLIGRQGALCGNLNYVEGKSFISEHAIAVKANNENETKFLYYNFSRLNLNKLSEASAQPGLSVEKLLKLETLVPPLAEQQKIAQALTDADDYISALEKLIEKKKMIKEGLMVNLLTGKQRLKEFAFNEDGTEKGYKDSELGKIPEDWDLKYFTDVFSFLSTASFSRDQLTTEENTSACIHYGDIHTKLDYFIDTNSFISGYVSASQVMNRTGFVGDSIF